MIHIQQDVQSPQKNMVEFQLKSRGIRNEAVLKAMAKVPRHLFVPESLKDLAYDDTSLPIGFEQTISQPYIVALISEAANITTESRILEIGTGCGYQAAVLSLLGKEVYTIELIASLAESATKRLRDLGYENIHVKQGDGNQGWKEHAPFDVIVVTAAASEIPKALLEQLSDQGRIIMPVGEPMCQQLMRLTKMGNGNLKTEPLGHVVFVPLRSEGDQKD